MRRWNLTWLEAQKDKGKVSQAFNVKGSFASLHFNSLFLGRFFSDGAHFAIESSAISKLIHPRLEGKVPSSGKTEKSDRVFGTRFLVALSLLPLNQA